MTPKVVGVFIGPGNLFLNHVAYKNMLSPEEERTLIASAVSGEQSALEKLLLAHYDVLVQHITPKIGLHMQTAISSDDVLQDTFIQAFRDVRKFELREGSSFVGWLKAIAENRLMDAIKALQRKKRGGGFNRFQAADAYRSSIADFIVVLEDGAESPSRVVAKHEAIDALEIAIASLPDDQRQAVRLRCLEGLSVDQTAEKMNKTASAVRSLVHRAKQALQASMYRSSIWLTKR